MKWLYSNSFTNEHSPIHSTKCSVDWYSPYSFHLLYNADTLSSQRTISIYTENPNCPNSTLCTHMFVISYLTRGTLWQRLPLRFLHLLVTNQTCPVIVFFFQRHQLLENSRLLLFNSAQFRGQALQGNFELFLFLNHSGTRKVHQLQ